MKRFLILIVVALVSISALVAIAATTSYTVPPPRAGRTDRATARYATAHEDFLVIDWLSADLADRTESIDGNLSGYLERIVYSHNGNDTSWSLTVADADGITLYSDTTANAMADPCSYIVVHTDASGNKYGGVPFYGGLTIAIANADGGTGSAVSVRLYVKEAWRE